MKQILNAIAKHPVIYYFSTTILLVCCLVIIKNPHPLLTTAFVFLPLLILLVPVLANKIDPAGIVSLSEKTVEVFERKPANRRVLSLIRHRESYSKYNPASATFSAATVGGVTTGGWSIKEAHYSTEMGSGTNKYLLCYTPNVYYKDKCTLPNRVILTKNDVQAAMNQGLSRYLDGNTLVLKNTNEWKNAKAASDIYASTGDFYAASNLLANDYTASLLTQSEMQKILDFLCGDNKEESIIAPGKYNCNKCGATFSIPYDTCPYCGAKESISK